MFGIIQSSACYNTKDNALFWNDSMISLVAVSADRCERLATTSFVSPQPRYDLEDECHKSAAGVLFPDLHIENEGQGDALDDECPGNLATVRECVSLARVLE